VNLAANSQSGSNFSFIIMLVLLFGAMYFLMIRPQQRRRRAAEEMQSSIRPGDEVITVGGLYGTVTDIDDETVTLEVASGVTNRYARGAISRVVAPAAREEAEDDTGTDAGQVVERE
jgi:preprotein translocase subunit YajC